MPKMTPKDFFLHIGIIATLYVSAISLITLLFQVVNVLHPDPLYTYVDPYSSGIRWAIASLLIIFPLFVLLSWLLEREYRVMPEKRDLGIKRWLTFLTLFITGAAIATDLIVLINSFLGGEISARFFLKVVVVLVVAGGVFGYYLWDLRRNAAVVDKKPKLFAIVAIAVVVLSVAGGFLVMGSPITQRHMRFDEAKINDLRSIQTQIAYYWQLKRVLPAELSDLNNSLSGFYLPADPQNGEGYGYRKISDLKFEICANFNLETAEDSMTNSQTYPKSATFANDSWQHGAGSVCFERTIDPQLYPVINR